MIAIDEVKECGIRTNFIGFYVRTIEGSEFEFRCENVEIAKDWVSKIKVNNVFFFFFFLFFFFDNN
jgi:hypothetical protein